MKHLILIAAILMWGKTYAATGTDFIITVNTTKAATSNSTSFILPLPGEGTYNYGVDWTNDGTIDNTYTSNTSVTHDFGTAGTYTIRITGTFPRIYFNADYGDSRKLMTIVQWGSSMKWTSFYKAFLFCTNLVITATDVPVLTGVTDLSSMFSGCYSLTTLGNANWDTQTITNMSGMFNDDVVFNQDIGSWNTIKVTNTNTMFGGTAAFNNGGSASIGNWNTAAVTNMSGMFGNTKSFNQNIGSWNTANVTAMDYMFYNATAFNQNIGGWNTIKVANTTYMFFSATAFNNGGSSSIGNWKTPAVTNTSYMFNFASAFNQDLSGWNTANVTDMRYMFSDATSFNQNLGGWNIGMVTLMDYMLTRCGLNVANYDATLIGWQTHTHQNWVSLDADYLHFCASTAQRNLLMSASNWQFWGDIGPATPTLPDIGTSVTTASVLTCSNGTDNGYQIFTDADAFQKYLSINPNSNTGYNFTTNKPMVGYNKPAVNHQAKSNGSTSATVLANQMWTIRDGGTNNYPTGMTVRLYYDPADTLAAKNALPAYSTRITSQWFKFSGSTHTANVAAILAAQTATGLPGATFLTPSATGTESGVAWVEFSGITSFSTFGYLAARTTTVLPITLTSFAGTASGCTANLAWQTATEQNSSYYVVEASLDGSSFGQVGKVTSKNNATGAAYSFAHTLGSGTTYFRLKAVDVDGQFTYSPTVAVTGTGTCGTTVLVRVSPNPTSNLLNVQGLVRGNHIVLMSASGQKLTELDATSTSQVISLSGYAKGLYILCIQARDGSNISNVRVIKE